MAVIRALRDNDKLIDNSEIEDVEKAFERLGYSTDDFDFKVEDNTDYSFVLHHIKSTVHVTFKPKGIKRSYQAGHQSTFAAELERDLQSGVFK